jgi:phosphate transport system ATP-binding protein
MEPQPPPLIRVRDFSLTSGSGPILRRLTLDVLRNEILGVIGPAGSGKTSFLRSLNRLNDLAPGFRAEGEIEIEGRSILGSEVNVVELRRRLGMVFATPIPLPRSIFENIVFGARLSGVHGRIRLLELAEESLLQAGLWEEVRDRLDESALKLSGGQQQRLCLARILALKPEVILLDEPTSGLDPISTHKIEESLRKLRAAYTIVLVTNNVKQAARVADRTAFFLSGELIEIAPTARLFTAPEDQRTNDYISGRFG